MAQREYDLIAIGGGTAGLVSAVGGAYLGVKTAIVERAALGGDCLWTGCVPSKALIASARTAQSIRNATSLGLPPLDPAPDFRSVMERMRQARGRVAMHDDPERFAKMGVDVHIGSARFVGSGTVEVEGVGVLASKRIVIATGSKPALPDIPGLGDAGYVTHETVLDTESLPASVLILGAGPIGIEFAQIFTRLGSTVTVVDIADEILSKEDPDVSAIVRRQLETEGVRFVLGAEPVEVRREGSVRTVTLASDVRLSAELFFVATGRTPNTTGLGLEHVEIATDRGAVVVDPRLRTSARGVWAAGDVTGGPQFTHAAEAMAKTVVRNALVPFWSKVDLTAVPRVTYSDPEVAHVGLGEHDANAMGATTYRYDFAELDRAITDGATTGFTKISADAKGRILGATIVGRDAGELIMPIVLARRHGLTLADIAGSVFPYPTMVEGVKRAANEYQRDRLEGFGGRMLRRVVRWLP